MKGCSYPLLDDAIAPQYTCKGEEYADVDTTDLVA
jgi:hypothetical protein